MNSFLPSSAVRAGYSALIERYALRVSRPLRLFAIGEKHSIQEFQGWTLLTPRHAPQDTLLGQLTFALKYEGVQLDILRAVFCKVGAQAIVALVHEQPAGGYSRRIWFLYEWLLQETLPLEDLRQGNYVDLLDSKKQFPGPVRKVRRQRINNNLPGVPDFCPLIERTPQLDTWISCDLSEQAQQVTAQCHPDLLARAAAFLLLADSKSSYVIEGEQPPHTRIERWGRLLGEAGRQPLTLEHLVHLQRMVLADERFVTPGLRTQGGFIGMHDRHTGLPLPEHISAKAADLPRLMQGMLDAWALLRQSDYPPVLLATAMAFGFVFIHPFEDGNGRLHRYLIHHVLADSGFVPKGLVFPVSAVILEQVDAYREVLQAYSRPRLDCVDWQPTQRNNVEVTNDTLDLYRYFDATAQAEFLYACVGHTVHKTLPNEIDYLQKHDVYTAFISARFDMPAGTQDLLLRFLQSGKGQLSKRAREKEFAVLTAEEARMIEAEYQRVFM